jgi:uncharacterized protein
MALTNYLLHSFLMTWIMYGYGFGLVNGNSGAVTLFLGTNILHLAMMGLSWVWLKRVRFGPLEWAWRSLTYGEFQSFSRLNS